MSLAFIEWRRRIGAWVAALSPRERGFAALFAAALGLAGVAQAFASVSMAHEDALRAQSDWRVIEERHKAFRSPAFVDAAELAARAARRASMGGDTVHIARARMQAEVEALAMSAGLRSIEVTLLPRARARSDQTAGSGVEAMTIQLESEFDAADFVRFVEALSASEQSLVPVSVDVAQGGDGARMMMQIRGYALATDPGA